MSAMQPASQQMAAEIMLYDNAAALLRTLQELAAHGFETRPFNWRDPCGTNTRWLLAWTTTPLDIDGFWRLVTDIVEPMNGEILAGGPTTDDQLVAWQARDGG